MSSLCDRSGDRPKSSKLVHGLNIAALAARTGVPPHTLRKWEQRYGVLRPSRTSGRQRRYSERDVARVHWLRDRIAEGYRIGEAAILLGPGDGAPQSPGKLREALLRAIRISDTAAVERLLEHALVLLPLDEALSRVVHPALVRVGELWRDGSLSVAQEHVFSNAVRGQLEQRLADGGAVRGTAVLACGPGERHELGLLSLAVLLRADGWRTVYLGAATPLRDAVELTRELGAGMLALSVTMTNACSELARGLRRSGPLDAHVIVGGGAADLATARALGVAYGGSDLAKTVARLRGVAA